MSEITGNVLKSFSFITILIELSVFKGREAKLNRAIFQTLALKGPQTIYNITKTRELSGSLGTFITET